MADYPAITEAELSEYELVLAVDASGSMARVDPGKSQSRWAIAQEMVAAAANFMTKVDPSGIDIVIFGQGDITVRRGVKTSADVSTLFQTMQPKGGTPTHLAFDEISKIIGENAGKGHIVMCVTDGTPDNEGALAESLARIIKPMTSDSKFAVQFVQVGSDVDATKFLKRLDDDFVRTMKVQHDMIDVCTIEESEKLSFEQMLSKALHD